MAFWKKSDDPWDIDPEKKKKQAATTWWENDTPAEPDPVGAASGRPEEVAPKAQRLGDSIKGFFGGEKEEEAPVPAEKCPWCGKDMERCWINGGQGIVTWRNWKVRGLGLRRPTGWKEISLLDEGDFVPRKIAWLCPDCGKMVMEVPLPPGPNYTWENGQVKLPDDTEKEET